MTKTLRSSAPLAILLSLGLGGCFNASDDMAAGADESGGSDGAGDTAGDAGDAGSTSGAADSGNADADGDSGGPAGDTGGADTGTPADDSGGSDGPMMPEPPTILDVTPADGATGVGADTVITITFSEPMDKASTQVAYQSTQLPPAVVSFSWNDTGDVLAITPNIPLPYAWGNDPDTSPANTFEIGLSTAAESDAGVALEEPLSVSFSTLRHLSHTIARDQDMTGKRTFVGNKTDTPYVGDYSDNDYARYYLTFDLQNMAPDAVEVLSAELHAARSIGVSGDPFGDLGYLMYQRIAYPTLDDATFGTAGIGNAAPLLQSEGEMSVARDVADHLDAVLADPATYDERLQFRILWVLNETDGNSDYDGVSLVPSELTLDVTYLAP